MSVPRSTRRLSAWLAMLALVLNALLPLVAQAMRAPAGPAGLHEICSATGLVMVRPHDSRRDQSPAQSAAPLKDCPFCHLHHDGAGLPPVQTALFLPPGRAEMPPAFYQAAHRSTVWLSARSRAPPLLA